MQIRRAWPEEFGACADLYVRVLVDTFTWLPAERHRRDDFLRAAKDEEIYVAIRDGAAEGGVVEDGMILGLAGFYRPQNFLHSLYVAERGRGIGKALLDHISAGASGPVSLKVQKPNLRAQAFYRREGFICTEAGRDPGSDVEWLRMVQAPSAAKS